MKPFVVSLCDRTGRMVRPWLEAGYDAFTIDIQPGINHHPCRTHHQIDLHDDLVIEGTPAAVFAFPPCTDLAGSGARWYKDKGLGRLIEALRLVERCRVLCETMKAPWLLENPSGVLSTYWRKPDYTFHPVHYRGYSPEPEADDYTKKTCLWTGGGFLMPDRKPGDPTLGSKMWLMPPSPDRANARSETPLGFAYAVFKANSECSHTNVA